jgi:predicted small metal-binding protein
MKYKLACDCGWETQGSEDELVAATQEHGRQLHNMDLTPEQAMAMASPVEE